MLSKISHMITLLHRVTVLYSKGKGTIGMSAMVKASCSSEAREVILLAREVQGGNGILLENRTMKALMDIESLHTYEGTYEVNALVAGKEITGLSAFT
eukprot:CAMPEP_0170543386 /NCGR_PEP_ID=MMETSP0211-20121228/2510_1 /TAXON_ID=311385 /ORGANISM="Pseudokeronopsis sp., Strain OXSARD2" /LENGTH=97 /DNA_ID=CAMNT_0010846729 /DNA_START=942 /DNA_END=1235 /DNA_ORIENTATION=+